MVILRYKDAKKLGEKELAERLNEFKLELAKERANIAIGAAVVSPGKIKEIRRGIARIETEKSARRNTAPEAKPKAAAPKAAPIKAAAAKAQKPAKTHSSEPKGESVKQ